MLVAIALLRAELDGAVRWRSGWKDVLVGRAHSWEQEASAQLRTQPLAPCWCI